MDCRADRSRSAGRCGRAELAALSEQLEAWRDALEHYEAHRTFRTCFRLSAPEEAAPAAADAMPAAAEDPAAAPAEEPSPPGPADEPVAQEPWRRDPAAGERRPERARPGAGRVELQRRRPARARPPVEDPQERLLGGLGHALRLWPELEPALREIAPTGSSSTPTPPSGSCATRFPRWSRLASAC